MLTAGWTGSIRCGNTAAYPAFPSPVKAGTMRLSPVMPPTPSALRWAWPGADAGGTRQLCHCPFGGRCAHRRPRLRSAVRRGRQRGAAHHYSERYGMSITPNVGGMAHYLAKQRLKPPTPPSSGGTGN
jgi:hypothetical protein